MAKRARAREAAITLRLEPGCRECWECQGPLHVTYYKTRHVVTLTGLRRLLLQIRRCVKPECPRYHQFYRPEAEGAFALPHAEVGLDAIARVGALRFADHRSVPEIHRHLQQSGVAVGAHGAPSDRALRGVAGGAHCRPGRASRAAASPGGVMLALDGLQPDVGHEVLWVLRDVLSGEVLLARSLLSATVADLAALLQEAQAVKTALPGVPQQLCQFHYLREAAGSIYEADRHAKKELKKRMRGVRPIERRLEGEGSQQTEPAARAASEAVRGYCLAIRSALTDDGRPPLAAAGLQLQNRLATIQASVARVLEQRRAAEVPGAEKRGSFAS